ncbi:MAG TPA: hypothetical protein VIT44_15315 [Cyclobacteriaceae bacterium]
MRKLLILMAFCGVFLQASAQNDRKDKTAVTFEELYDEPYSVNKLFVGFQPLYFDVFATNVNAGFGAEASYFYKEKLDFKVNFRMPYSASFYDLSRDLSRKNGPKYDNGTEIVDMIHTKPVNFTYFEAGGTYHIKDFDKASKTKMVLYKNSYKGDKWAARVPLRAEVPCKVRNIYGARLGFIYWQSALDLSRVMSKQGIGNESLVNSEGVGLPATFENPLNGGQTEPMNVYGNMHSTNIYIGGSMSWIRNVAVSFDKYEEGVDDGMLTTYFDIMFAPSLKLDPISYTDPTTKIRSDYSTDAVKTKPLGFRLGLDGKFNRTLSWGYGGEFGYRPSVSGKGFFAMLKISLPIYGTNLDYKVESFGK